MKLELLIKVIDRSVERDPEDIEAAKLKKLFDGIQEEDDEVKFTYRPYVIDLRDIATFGMEDQEHTKIFTPFGVSFAKVEYNTFLSIYETAIGVRVKCLDDFKIKRK